MNTQTFFNPEITLEELEKQYILASIRHHGGNKTKAARSLGVTIKTLYNKLHQWGVFDEYKHPRDQEDCIHE